LELARPFTAALLDNVPPVTFAPYLFGAYGYGEIADATVAQKATVDAGAVGLGMRTSAGTTVTGLPLGSSLAVEFGRQFSNVPGERVGYRTNVTLNVTF
jgi:hypothetical protein